MGRETRSNVPRTTDWSLHVLRQKNAINMLSFDTIFELLSQRRRRFVIHYLADVDHGASDLDDITAQVVAWENADTKGQLDANAESRVRQSLHNVHLPMLADANVIDYDIRSKSVRYWGHPVVEEYAEHIAPVELPDE